MEKAECKRCGSKEVMKWGTQLRAGGRAQDYKCKSCGARFNLPLFYHQEIEGGKIEKKSRYVVTTAQNLTSPHFGLSLIHI